MRRHSPVVPGMGRPFILTIASLAWLAVVAACGDSPAPSAPSAPSAPLRVSGPLAHAGSCAPLPTGAVHWYRGESGGADEIGGAVGTLVGGVTTIAGLVGQSLHFDGSTGYVALPPVLPTSAGTLEFWVHRDSYAPGAGYDVLMGGVDRPFGDGRATVFALYSGGPSAPNTLQWEFGQATAMHSSGSIAPGAWHHAAIAWTVAADNSASAAVYVDGAAAGSVSTTLTAGHHGFAAPWIGAYNDVGTGATARNFVNGAVDEVTIYDRVLTAPEIAEIFAAGSAGKCSSAPPPPPPPTFAFNGFFSPVVNPPALNVANSGRAIPVKFSLGGNQGLDIFAPGSPSSEQVACDGMASLGDDIPAVTSGGSGLSYDAASDTYAYAWKTEKSWAGTCRSLHVGLVDGTVHSLNVKFR